MGQEDSSRKSTIKKGFVNFRAIGGLVLLVGIIGFALNQLRPTYIQEKTALLTSTKPFCIFTKLSSPYADIQFEYQENGEVYVVRADADCDDLNPDEIFGDVSIIGENIKLEYRNGKPINLIRKNGSKLKVEYSHPIHSLFSSRIHVYETIEHMRNSNSTKAISECLLIKNDNHHDRCLSYQAAFQENVGICDMMILSSYQDKCKEWVMNLQEGLVNN